MMKKNLNANNNGRKDLLDEVDKSIDAKNEFGSLDWFIEYTGSGGNDVSEIKLKAAKEEIDKLKEKIAKRKALIDVYVRGEAKNEEIEIIESKIWLDLLFRKEVELQIKKWKDEIAARINAMEALELTPVGYQQIGNNIECELEIVNKERNRALYVDFSNISFNNEKGEHRHVEKIIWSDHEKSMQRSFLNNKAVNAKIQFRNIMYSKSTMSWMKIPIEASGISKIIVIKSKKRVDSKLL